MNNLSIWDKVKEVPQEAKKEIRAGRIKGFTDINPVWRLKKLTEVFGVCGFGWRYEIVKEWLERGSEDTISAFMQINLYVKVNNTWSEAIPGIGGNSFLAKEKGGLFQSDECYKMALTDAISVVCKALGVGADVYWDKDNTKYDQGPAPHPVKREIKMGDALSDKMMQYLYEREREAHAKKTNFIPAVFLMDNYMLSDQQISQINFRYEEFLKQLNK